MMFIVLIACVIVQHASALSNSFPYTQQLISSDQSKPTSATNETVLLLGKLSFNANTPYLTIDLDGLNNKVIFTLCYSVNSTINANFNSGASQASSPVSMGPYGIDDTKPTNGTASDGNGGNFSFAIDNADPLHPKVTLKAGKTGLGSVTVVADTIQIVVST